LEKEELSTGQRITVGETILFPIIRTSLTSYGSGSRGIVGSASKNLVGIVVVSPKRKYAMNAAGEEVPLEHYTEQVPEVKELLNGM